VREWIILDGHQIAVENIDRGVLLLHDRAEWVRRYKDEMRGGIILTIPFTILSGFGIVIALYVQPFIIPAVFLFLLIGFYLATSKMTQNEMRRGGAVPGIYEKGIEMPLFPNYYQRLFIPWEEMKSAELKSRGIFSADAVVVFEVNNSRWKWMFPENILGPEGYSFIKEKLTELDYVEGIRTKATSAPKLVLYSPQEGKVESIPGEEDGPG
jgi:hypothetical protein